MKFHVAFDGILENDISLKIWTKVLYDFVMNDNVGPWARVVRPTKFGRDSVVSQQEYEQKLKTIVKEAHKRD
ncbi:unnamed protein product [Rotaria sp. Silwood1]|nr:unnamed protein product [Rotaria sp. Silwood1]